MLSSFEKFRLLWWKNLANVSQKLYYTVIFIMILNVIVSGILSFVKQNTFNIEYEDETRFLQFETRCQIYGNLKNKNEIVYCPANDTKINELMRAVLKDFNRYTRYPNQLIKLANHDQLFDYLEKWDPLVGVTFNNSDPKNLEYTLSFLIRSSAGEWKTNKLQKRKILDNLPREFEYDRGAEPQSYAHCFSKMQDLIETNYLKLKTVENPPHISLQRFPIAPFTVKASFKRLLYILPLAFLITYSLSMDNLLLEVALEREMNIKTFLKTLGIARRLQWKAWFAKALGVNCISISLFTFLLTGIFRTDPDSTIFYYSNPFLIWIFLLFYLFSMITYSFLLSMFFKKAKIASVVGLLIWILTYIPYNTYFIKTDLVDEVDVLPNFLMSLLPNTALGFGFSTILVMEHKEIGLHFSNLFTRNHYTSISVGDVLLTFLLSTFFFLLLVLHLEQTYYEVKKPKRWFYPFSTIYDYIFKNSYENLNDTALFVKEEKRFEPEPAAEECGLLIKNLSKIVKKKIVLENLNLNVQKDQITVILGSNNSGKSHLISVLAGILKPDHGTVVMHNKDIRENPEIMEEYLGICLQKCVLFNHLTVEDHIVFYCKLKGMTSDHLIKEEVKKYAEKLELKVDLKNRKKNLRHIEQRKLAIAIALCADSSIVLLDEPTIGLDPNEKRLIWALLDEERKGRTILVTTHSPDEAEKIGSRIAILSDKHIVAAGSPAFLKKQFGVGYRLMCSKGNECETEEITDVIRSFIPDIAVHRDVGTEVVYILDEIYKSTFPELFRTLETELERLNIKDFTVSLMNLEDAFLKINSHSETLVDTRIARDDVVNIPDEQPMMNSFDSDNMHRLAGTPLMLSRILAMIIKKYYYFRRYYRMLLINLIISMFTVFIILSLPESKNPEYQSLKISLANYTNTNVYMQSDNSSAANIYKEMIEKSQNVVVVPSDVDMNDFIIKNGTDYVIGATFSDNEVVGWFNNEYYHSQPLTMNLINQALLKDSVGKEYSITVWNKPFYFSDEAWFDQFFQKLDMTRLSITLVIVYTYWVIIFVTVHVKERLSRSKSLQFICGVNKFTFWSVSLIVDLFVFIIVAFFIVFEIGLITFSDSQFVVNMTFLVSVSGFFGFSAICFMYVQSFCTKESFGAKMNILLLSSFSAMVYVTHFIVFENFQQSVFFKLIFGMMPYFELFYIINNSMFYSESEVLKHYCKAFDPENCTLEDVCRKDNFFCNTSSFIISQQLIWTGIFYFLLVMFQEYNVYERLALRCRSIEPESIEDYDPDVQEEINRVNSISATELNDYGVVMRNVQGISDFYPKMKKLSLVVEEGSCLGILGSKFSGKSNILKMIVDGQLSVSGEVYIRGHSLNLNSYEAQQMIGYCPANSALLKYLTCRENLEIFGLIKGIPRRVVQKEIRTMSDDLKFTAYLDKIVNQCSKPVQRKISVSIALMGDPHVILLDEATSDLDSDCRQKLFTLLNKRRMDGKSIIIASNNLEECEALCTKLAIVVKGEIVCIGTPQYLRGKFSKGISLVLKLIQLEPHSTVTRQVQVDHVKEFVKQYFPSSEFGEEKDNKLTFNLGQNDLKWSLLFEALEDNKEKLYIDSYSFVETSLGQVYLDLTKITETEDS